MVDPSKKPAHLTGIDISTRIQAKLNVKKRNWASWVARKKERLTGADIAKRIQAKLIVKQMTLMGDHVTAPRTLLGLACQR